MRRRSAPQKVGELMDDALPKEGMSRGLERDLHTLQEDFKTLRSDMRSDLHDLRRDLARVVKDAADTAGHTAAQGRHAVQRVEREAQEHPLASIFLALSFGLGLGLLLGRRSARHQAPS